MKHKFLLILTAATLLASSSAKAWGGFGHTIVAYTAEQYLTPEAKAKCEQYLGHSVPYCASWMDYWRAIPPYKESTHWHVCHADENNNLVQDKDRCAALQITRLCKELKNYSKLPAEQVELDLKLLIHMVGDMHCPSHIVYTPKVKNNNIRVKGKKLNRHTFWDSSPAIFYPKLDAEKYFNHFEVATDKQIKRYCKGTPEAWAMTQAAIMRRTYELYEDGAEYTKLPLEVRNEMIQLTNDNIFKAGYRLAYLLNKIFAK